MPYFKTENQSEYFMRVVRSIINLRNAQKKVIADRQKAIDINNEMRYAINS